MKTILLLPVILLLVTAFGLQARTWTNSSGVQLEAEFLGMSGDKVKLKRDADGKIFDIPLATLSEADRAWVEENGAAAAAAAPAGGGEGDWPGWRGANQDAISPDTGLLKRWPEGGPELLWSYEDAGMGYSSAAVVGGRYYTLGAKGGKVFVLCLDANTGAETWRTEIESDPESYNTGWGAGTRSTPAVSDGHVYALGVGGTIACLGAEDGSVKWSKNLVSDFGGEVSKWGYSESPTIDGDKVLVTPGGAQGAIVALNKATGAKIWQSKGLSDKAEYSSVVRADVDGKRQDVQLFMNTLAGVDAETGKVLWTSAWEPGKVAVIPTPIYRDGHVYMTSGYKAGGRLLKISGEAAEEVWMNDEMQNHHGGVILIGDHVYGFTDQKRGNLMCQNFMTGEVAWMHRVDRELTKGSVHAVDGMLVRFNEDGGWVYLVEANPREYVERGKFQLPKQTSLREDNKGKIWSHPVVIGGKLYLRDCDLIFCYDVKG